MARLFLINPPTDETVRTPLLSFLYLAAALRRGGHQVALLDCSAEFAPKDHVEIVARALEFAPDLVGIHCKTLYAQDAYALARSFTGMAITTAKSTTEAKNPRPSVNAVMSPAAVPRANVTMTVAQ